MEHAGVRLVPLPTIDKTHLSTLSHGFVSSIVSRFGRYDVILVVNIANVPYCMLSRLTGQRVVLNTDGQEWLRGKWGWVGRAYFKWCARRARLAASALISDSCEMKRIYAAEFDSDSTVIPYASVDWPTEDRARILQDFGVAPRQFLIVAARLNPENNVDHIADAYSRSSLSIPLLVLGVANYDSEPAKRIHALAIRDDRIRPVGHVGDRAAFGVLLSQALAYVHGHSVGGMNPSLVEAMSAGALTVALSTPFNREVLGETGLYFDLDGRSLVEAFDSLQQMDEVLHEKYRTLAAARATERYSLPAVASSYELLLAKVAGLKSGWSRTHFLTPWDDLSDDGT
jgi:glycosyltransferase involved in cell wall biosynthesis